MGPGTFEPVPGTLLHCLEDGLQALWTWCTWLGANATMAAWLYEQTGQRLSRAVVIKNWPVLAPHCVLLPINLHRLFELHRAGRCQRAPHSQPPSTAGSSLRT